MKFISVCLMFIIGIASGKIWAQSSDPLAKASLLKAQKMIFKKEYAKAEAYLRRSINRVQDKETLWLELGHLAIMQNKFPEAASYYKMAYYIKPANRERYGLLLVDALIKANDWLNAAYYLNTIRERSNWTEEKKQLYRKLRYMIEHSELYTKNVSNEVEIRNAGPAVNDKYDEYFPFLTENDSLLYITIRKNNEEKIYYSFRDTCNEVWNVPKLMGAPTQALLAESALFRSYNEKYMLFMRCQNNTERGMGQGGCDICFAYQARPKEWVVSDPFGINTNTPAYEGMATMDAESKTVYFVSNRVGGFGGMDIWKAEFKDGRWYPPENLGPNINTPGDEMAPFIAPDGKTLYFSSNGHPGVGGLDIFMARKEGNGWTKPQNLGVPINSQFDDFGISVSAVGTKTYFASNRPGGYGGFDIYEFDMPLKFMYEPTVFYSGFVVDTVAKDVITYATIEVYDSEGNKVITTESNPGDGSYFFALPYRGSYTATVFRWGYPDLIVPLETSSNFGYVKQNFYMLTEEERELIEIQDEIIEDDDDGYYNQVDDIDITSDSEDKIRVHVNYRLMVEIKPMDLIKGEHSLIESSE